MQAYTGNRKKAANVNNLLQLNRHFKLNISDKSKQFMEAAVEFYIKAAKTAIWTGQIQTFTNTADTKNAGKKESDLQPMHCDKQANNYAKNFIIMVSGLQH